MWSKVSGVDELALARKGGRPGNALADALYSLVFAATLSDAERRLSELGSLYYLQPEDQAEIFLGPQEAPTPIVDSTYADDAMFPCVCEHNDRIGRDIAASVTAIVGAAAKYGFRYSFVNNKAKVILALRGKGKRWAERDIFVERKGLVWMPDVGASISVVRQDKSLGTIVEAFGDLGPEIASRRSSARLVLRPLNKGAFRSPLVPLLPKLQFARALVHTRLMYNFETWPSIRVKPWASLVASYTEALRKAQHSEWSFEGRLPSDEAVLLGAESAPLEAVLWYRRM